MSANDNAIRPTQGSDRGESYTWRGRDGQLYGATLNHGDVNDLRQFNSVVDVLKLLAALGDQGKEMGA